ncbi:GPI mannosyltransferase 2 [Drosophila albomicans]|uniref:GPI mannosyltransferase 2 n=1 Tax=Drosophila albomicans TaxID=7291 RepID=A0A6P8WX65_DROAB|nr:GPI mannosyltransferase 2 [Drosophila albomicans]XP_034103988.1 GPI mannosyltransferase 2 [Drosophila albomicans]
MTLKVTKLALSSRLIVLAVQLVSNWVVPDHKPDVFRMPLPPEGYTKGPLPWLDKLIVGCLNGLRHWDGEYFLHIANNLYTYENTLAFYPLYPTMVRYIAMACQSLYVPLSMQSLTLVVGVALNVWLFCEAANLLYQLTQRMFNDLNKSWNAALIFCFNPASIFFSAVYSESCFAYTSFFLMLECVKPHQKFNYIRIGVSLSACIMCRSNGLIALGFPLYFFLRHVLLTANAKRCRQVFKMTLAVIVPLIILHAYYFYIYRLYCIPSVKVNIPQHVQAYASERNYLLAGRGPEGSPWCQYTLPFPYNYVQSNYWDVGFLRYYQWSQLPNFILALPMLLFMNWHCCDYLWSFATRKWAPTASWRDVLKVQKTLPFVLHGAFLTLVCALFVHIQVSTRLLASATPIFYWFAADHMPRSLDQLKFRTKAGALFFWCTVYCACGTVLFSNNYPWT